MPGPRTSTWARTGRKTAGTCTTGLPRPKRRRIPHTCSSVGDAKPETPDYDVWGDPTPDVSLHTGTEHLSEAEDVVLASGHDITPERLERVRRLLAEEGAAGVEKLLH